MCVSVLSVCVCVCAYLCVIVVTTIQLSRVSGCMCLSAPIRLSVHVCVWCLCACVYVVCSPIVSPQNSQGGGNTDCLHLLDWVAPHSPTPPFCPYPLSLPIIISPLSPPSPPFLTPQTPSEHRYVERSPGAGVRYTMLRGLNQQAVLDRQVNTLFVEIVCFVAV